MSEERDRLLPQLEELRWRNRQADKELQQLKDATEAAQQVGFTGIKKHNLEGDAMEGSPLDSHGVLPEHPHQRFALPAEP